MIKRLVKTAISGRLWQKKLVLLLGPRQVGKTTLVRETMREQGGRTVYLSGDDPGLRAQLADAPLERLRSLVQSYDLIFLDEAQRIRNIGITLKLLVDHFPEKQVVATGSSSFDLANVINEPLTGRKYEFYLYPISWQEWSNHVGAFQAEAGLEQRLLFGMYPEVLTRPGEEKTVLQGLASGNLYKDLLSFAPIRKPDLLEKLLQALALQIGSEVSYNKLANLLKVDKQTVANYITALEQAYVVFRLGPFSCNLRQEIARTRKIYFYDNGIRNAVLGNFAPLDLRQDTGALWENFLLGERLKRNHYAGRTFVNTWFWRTKQGQEIDYLEEIDGRFEAFEFKWNPQRKGRFPAAFIQAYPVASSSTVHPGNFGTFLRSEAADY